VKLMLVKPENIIPNYESTIYAIFGYAVPSLYIDTECINQGLYGYVDWINRRIAISDVVLRFTNEKAKAFVVIHELLHLFYTPNSLFSIIKGVINFYKEINTTERISYRTVLSLILLASEVDNLLFMEEFNLFDELYTAFRREINKECYVVELMRAYHDEFKRIHDMYKLYSQTAERLSKIASIIYSRFSKKVPSYLRREIEKLKEEILRRFIGYNVDEASIERLLFEYAKGVDDVYELYKVARVLEQVIKECTGKKIRIEMKLLKNRGQRLEGSRGVGSEEPESGLAIDVIFYRAKAHNVLVDILIKGKKLGRPLPIAYTRWKLLEDKIDDLDMYQTKVSSGRKIVWNVTTKKRIVKTVSTGYEEQSKNPVFISIDVSGSVGKPTGKLTNVIDYELVTLFAVLEYCKRARVPVGIQFWSTREVHVEPTFDYSKVENFIINTVRDLRILGGGTWVSLALTLAEKLKDTTYIIISDGRWYYSLSELKLIDKLKHVYYVLYISPSEKYAVWDSIGVLKRIQREGRVVFLNPNIDIARETLKIIIGKKE